MVNDDDTTGPYRESFGEYLRRHREASGKTVEQIARTTRISKRYLQAFEDNDTAHLPEDVFARGFLRSYSGEIGMDVDECVARYDRFRRSTMPTQIRDVKSSRSSPWGGVGELGDSPVKMPKGLMNLFWLGFVVVALIVGTLAILRFMPIGSNDNASSQVAEENGNEAGSLSGEDSPADSAPTTAPSPSPSAAAQPSAAPSVAMPTPTPIRPSVLAITAKKDAKITVRLDENALQDLELKQGDTQTLNVFREIEIRTSDKSAFSMKYNGKPLEVSGPVVRLFNLYLYQKKSNP